MRTSPLRAAFRCTPVGSGGVHVVRRQRAMKDGARLAGSAGFGWTPVGSGAVQVGRRQRAMARSAPAASAESAR